MELNPTNAFGELLLDLIEAQYGDFDAGIAALMDTTGLEEEEVVAVVQGDTIVDEAGLLEAIVDAFPNADDDDLEIIVQVATAVDEADREALITEIDATEGAIEENVMAAEEAAQAEAAYASQLANEEDMNIANFAANTYDAVNYQGHKVANVENRLAQFEYYNGLLYELDKLNERAEFAVAQGVLPPSQKRMLLGDFMDSDDRVAQFMNVAQANGVSPEELLFATNFSLGLLERSGQYIEFRDYSLSDEDVAVAEFSAGLDATISADIDAIFNY